MRTAKEVLKETIGTNRGQISHSLIYVAMKIYAMEALAECKVRAKKDTEYFIDLEVITLVKPDLL